MTQPYQPGSRDPRQPFGRQAPAPVHTSQFAPPPSRRPLWVTLAVLAAVAVLLLAAIKMGTSGDAEPQAAPTETVSVSEQDQQTTQAPTDGATPGTGVPTSTRFENARDDSSGTFEVLNHRWTTEGLLLTLRVRLDTGQQRLGFFALDNGKTAQKYDPSPTGPDYLEGQSILAGQTLTGTVLFEMPQSDATIMLAGSSGQQVTALKVSG
ncbi:hypothetical protein AAEX63_06135 [Luteococcus sp. H138]|uniref:hypothetical protein n=1 Tax=unclassified Luteococcus TaxID=2639923 RepID=UPI00313AC7C8